MEKERILIICNKSWETDALLSAIFNDEFRFGDLDFDIFSIRSLVLRWDKKLQGAPQPRLILDTERYQFEIWCIQNIMTPNPNSSDTYYYSRSIQKAIDFTKIVQFDKGKKVNMVVAFGTGGVPTEVSKNGSIVIGSNIFVYDASPELPADKKYFRSDFGKLIPSDINSLYFDQLNIGLSTLSVKMYFEKKALVPPINPSPYCQIFADKTIVAVSDVNVKSYADYKTADKAALDAYAVLKSTAVPYSVETTHGLTRLETEKSNFIFVTAVTDRDAYFDNEVTPRSSAQNFSCCFNGGLLISWLIPFMNKF
jgi:hypothetical protein